MVDFRGSTQEKRVSVMSHFRCGKASNDQKVPDRVGSEIFVIRKILFVRPDLIRRCYFCRQPAEAAQLISVAWKTF